MPKNTVLFYNLDTNIIKKLFNLKIIWVPVGCTGRRFHYCIHSCVYVDVFPCFAHVLVLIHAYVSFIFVVCTICWVCGGFRQCDGSPELAHCYLYLCVQGLRSALHVSIRKLVSEAPPINPPGARAVKMV